VAASLALSYDALPPAAQSAFAQLGVFVGSFTLDAAAAVVAVADSPAAELLDELYLNSLLEFDETTERYDLHDLARAFALARLTAGGDEPATRLRHARYYQQVANYAQFELYLKGKSLDGLALFDRERRQIDAGWGWAMEAAGRRGGEEAIDTLLLDFANATVSVGQLRYNMRHERIPQLEAQRDAARRLRHKVYEANTLGNLGNAYRNLGDYPRAIAYHEQDLAIRQAIGDWTGKGNALGNLGNAYNGSCNYPRAIDFYEQRLAIARAIGDRRGEGAALGNLGTAYTGLCDYHRAIAFHKQQLVIMRDLRDRRGESSALNNLGTACKKSGYYDWAVRFYEQALEVGQAIGDQISVSEISWNLGTTYEAQGDLARALPLIEHAAAFFHQIEHATRADEAASAAEEIRRKLADQTE
jgi:tetratricopeptide (TPR) repeat protein